MKRLVAALVLLAPLTALAASPVDGNWLGTLEVGSARLRIGFTFAHGTDGALSATMNSLDQGTGEMKGDHASFVAPKVEFDLGKLGVHYVGSLGNDTITGTFMQAGHAFPLVLKHTGAFEKPKRPQEPKRPFPYREEEVTLTVPGSYGPQRASAAVELKGTLSLPRGKGPFPAVLFITGSGPEDRDEQVFDHKPFLVISDALVRAGIATLRFDDRGTGTSGGTTKNMTVSDNARDALAEIEYLAKRPEIDRKRVGLIGHSEGGLIAPMVAAASKVPRFLVLLAGTGVPGRQILDTQVAAMMHAEGASAADIEKARTAMATSPAMATPWMQEFLALDPKPYLEKVKVPVLALNGEKDLQVDVSNLTAIGAALHAGGNKQVKIVRLPGLNHLFQHCTTGSPSEYSRIEETFSPEAIAIIRDFISSK
ncbi:MAG: alpha/beta fold hydrolase [Polyangia bacterium]